MDFKEGIRQWSRMCKTYVEIGEKNREGCAFYCPLATNGICGELMEEDEEEIEKGVAIIEKWASENPEPVYPTWGEWLTELYGATATLDERIPADIGKKLEIEPIFRIIPTEDA